MIISPSRFATAKTCWTKAFNLYHRQLGVPRTPQLADGGAFHAGIAEWLASRDTVKAFEIARVSFDEGMKDSVIPPEQIYLIEDNWNLVKVMIESVAAEPLDWVVIQPECKFEVPLGEQGHNCIFKHWYNKEIREEMWSEPTADDIIYNRVRSPHSGPAMNCSCWGPHKLTGRTDALINWRNTLWLLDWKTTSLSGDQFWDQFQLDFQITSYIYGIWKSSGGKLKPSGVMIGAIFRPSDSQVAAWNKKRKYGPNKGIIDYLSFGRESFLRTDEDLDRMEKQLFDFCEEWEWRVVTNRFGMSPISHACKSYNRRCDYMDNCVSHGRDLAGLVKIEKRDMIGEVKI